MLGKWKLFLLVTLILPNLALAEGEESGNFGTLLAPFAQIIGAIVLFIGTNPIIVGRIVVFVIILGVGIIVSNKTGSNMGRLMTLVAALIGIVTAGMMDSASIFMVIMFILLLGLMLVPLAILLVIWNLWKEYSSNEKEPSGIFYIFFGVILVIFGFLWQGVLMHNMANFKNIITTGQPLPGNTLPYLSQDLSASFFYTTAKPLLGWSIQLFDWVNISFAFTSLFGIIFLIYGLTTLFRGTGITLGLKENNSLFRATNSAAATFGGPDKVKDELKKVIQDIQEKLNLPVDQFKILEDVLRNYDNNKQSNKQQELEKMSKELMLAVKEAVKKLGERGKQK